MDPATSNTAQPETDERPLAAIYPVIMCGGAGTRLWPASRPSRPKPFLALIGERSLFQDTVLRVAPLAQNGGMVVVVGGIAHRRAIVEQLAEIGIKAQILLEPSPRDSAPAMAAAALWVQRRDATAILAVVASDHHIPDHDAFRLAVDTAGRAAAADGRIVTLGVVPTQPSSAYGYIRPTGCGLSLIDAFVEKPDAVTAATHIAAGFLWNSGNFIVSARTLLDELTRHAPEVMRAVGTALTLSTMSDAILTLDATFSEAPKVSIDYAVMERTRAASVLAVDFDWSDVGAWDAVADGGGGDPSRHVGEDGSGCLIRAPDGMVVATLGVSNLAIIVEPDAVLVCDLSRAGDLKRLVERVGRASPRHLDFPTAATETLSSGARRFADWLRLRALPIWSSLGQDVDGVFVEQLTLDGWQAPAPRRMRVQPRQIHVFAQAGAAGWRGQWRRCVTSGLDRLETDYRRDDGLYRTLLDASGEVLDDTAMVYDHAFVLLALASVQAAGVDAASEARAVALRDRLLAHAALPNGALKESGDRPYQANCHMHLLEACLAWEETGGDTGWGGLADSIVSLASTVFIDPTTGVLREVFNEAWTPLADDDARWIEPGHQFEWAALLTRHGRARGDPTTLSLARRLHDAGRMGLRGQPPAAVDTLGQNGSDASLSARLWPQTEWLKSALILAETEDRGGREPLLLEATAAIQAIWLYLTPDGLWRDKRQGGTFIDEPVPASSLYHLIGAFQQLAESGKAMALPELDTLTLR